MSAPVIDDETLRHDFKNQLAIIRGFAEILVATFESVDPRRRDVEEIHKAAVTALAMLARADSNAEVAHLDDPDC